MIVGVVLIVGIAVVVLLARGAGRVNRGSINNLPVTLLWALLNLSSPARQEWIAAMLAEHDSIDDPWVRRRFARGCLRAVILSRNAPNDTAMVVGGLTGILAACSVGLAGYGLLRYPGLRAGWTWAVYLAAFVVLVAVYAAAGSLLGRLGSTSARWAGMLAGVPGGLCGWWVAESNGVFAVAMMIVALSCASAAVYIARKRRRADEAAVAAGYASLTAGLLMFIAFVSTTYATNGGPATPLLLQEFARSGASDYRSWAVGDSLGGATFLLLFVPFVGVAMGSLAARLASPSRHPADASGS